MGQDLQTAFSIGKGIQYTPTVDAVLFCFANDVPSAYWNNWGSITLTVQEVPSG
jgi:hypothetical protein